MNKYSDFLYNNTALDDKAMEYFVQLILKNNSQIVKYPTFIIGTAVRSNQELIIPDAWTSTVIYGLKNLLNPSPQDSLLLKTITIILNINDHWIGAFIKFSTLNTTTTMHHTNTMDYHAQITIHDSLSSRTSTRQLKKCLSPLVNDISLTIFKRPCNITWIDLRKDIQPADNNDCGFYILSALYYKSTSQCAHFLSLSFLGAVDEIKSRLSRWTTSATRDPTRVPHIPEASTTNYTRSNFLCPWCGFHSPNLFPSMKHLLLRVTSGICLKSIDDHTFSELDWAIVENMIHIRQNESRHNELQRVWPEYTPQIFDGLIPTDPDLKQLVINEGRLYRAWWDSQEYILNKKWISEKKSKALQIQRILHESIPPELLRARLLLPWSTHIPFPGMSVFYRIYHPSFLQRQVVDGCLYDFSHNITNNSGADD